MSISRRKAIGVIGGGTILAATAGAAVFLNTRTPTRALQPWEEAGVYNEPRKYALSYAILAPNPHNRQPWLVDLSSSNSVTLYLDPERNLPHTDPFSRQLTIGLGCFLELMQIAASSIGYNVEIDLFPSGKDGPVAIATFSNGAQADPLFGHILNRRSCKEPFESTSIPNELIASVTPFGQVIQEPALVKKLRQLTWDAWHLEMNTPRTLKESVDLMRLGKSEINANPDGINLGGGFMEALIAIGVLTRDAQMDTHSTSFKQGIRIYQKIFQATPAYVIQTTAGNSRLDHIQTGRQWLRLNLTTTALGLSLHPISQILQEYDEMTDYRAQAHALLAKPGHTIQMLGRIGYGPQVEHAPRWSLDARIMNG